MFLLKLHKSRLIYNKNAAALINILWSFVYTLYRVKAKFCRFGRNPASKDCNL